MLPFAFSTKTKMLNMEWKALSNLPHIKSLKPQLSSWPLHSTVINQQALSGWAWGLSSTPLSPTPTPLLLLGESPYSSFTMQLKDISSGNLRIAGVLNPISHWSMIMLIILYRNPRVTGSSCASPTWGRWSTFSTSPNHLLYWRALGPMMPETNDDTEMCVYLTSPSIITALCLVFPTTVIFLNRQMMPKICPNVRDLC